MSSKADVFARHNGSPLETAMMDGEVATGGGSAPPPETRLAVQLAPDMVDFELKPAPVDPLTALSNAVHNLDLARWRARECRTAVSASREAFNLALNAWNRTMPIQTVEDLKKEWIRSNQEERARKASQGQLPYHPNVTQTARAMSGGNRRPGGGASYKRGAVSRAEARTIEVNKMAAARMGGSNAPRAKLPSDR
jgi:hypothetical protein